MLMQNVALRLIDRIWRHRALMWASRICDRRGLRFSIYGDGWEQHPTLGGHARGRVSHGADLCTVYAASRLTLNVTAYGSLHQRVAECALSGGVPVELVTGTACRVAYFRLQHLLMTEHASLASEAADHPGHAEFPVDRLPEARRFAALQSLELGRPIHRAVVERGPLYPHPVWLLDVDEAIDLLELGFHDERSLEHLIDRSSDDRWRDEQIARVLSYVRARCTHSVLADQLLAHYADRAAAQTVAA